MTRNRARLAIVAVVLIVGACSGSTPSGTPASSQVPVSSPPASTIPVVANTPAATVAPSIETGQASPPDVDPCTLLTQAEASTLMGKQLAAGVSEAVDQDRECTFKSGLTEVKVILAPEAPDVTTATTYWDAERAQAPAGITITDIGGFDRAAYGSGSSAGLSLSALFVIHGTWFFDLYCGFPACSQDASVTAANLIVGRLP